MQKFGGTSVADPAHILRAADKVLAARRAGHQVAVVVSAMGKTTDELERLAAQISPDPPKREMDMLLSTGEQVTIALMADGPGGQGPAGGELHRRAGADVD